MMNKYVKFCIIVTLALLILMGCGKTVAETVSVQESTADTVEETPDNNTGSHLNVAMFMWMEGLDPAVDWCGWTTSRCGVGETLLTIDENMNMVEQLADSWEQIDDVTYSFHIRQGVRFSNGNDMTPEIVKESILRTVETNSRGGNLKLESVEVSGENIIFKTVEPNSAFPYLLTEPMYCIVDTNADMSDGTGIPICTGPYMCTEYVTEQKYELAANEYYWGGRPQIDSITVLNISNDNKVNAMLAGDIDVTVAATPSTLSLLGNNPEIKMVRVTGTRECDLLMNCREDYPTGDINLRKALSYAIDRSIIAEIAGNGYAKPLTTPFPASVGYKTEEVQGQAYNTEKAKEFLTMAGYEDTDGNGYVEKDGEELVLKIALSESSAVYEAMQDMWKEIGIHVEVELMENVKEVRTSGDFDFIASNWQTANNGDGQSYLMNRWSDGGNDNYSSYHSDEFMDVMNRLNRAFEQKERIQCYKEAQQILADDCPNIFLYANENIALVNTSKVQNVTIYPIDYYQITGTWVPAQ